MRYELRNIFEYFEQFLFLEDYKWIYLHEFRYKAFI